MSEIIKDLEKWLKKQAEETANEDWSEGDPRARTKGRIIEVEGNIDYDLVNAFWIASMRKNRQKETEQPNQNI